MGIFETQLVVSNQHWVPFLRENRKTLLIQLDKDEVLAIVDHIFERCPTHPFNRSHYNELEALEGVERVQKFILLLEECGDDGLISTLVEYFEVEEKRQKFPVICEKLQQLQSKATIISVQKAEPEVVPANLNTDIPDFTLTIPTLHYICRQILIKNGEVKRHWGKIMSNMSGLEGVELQVHGNDENEGQEVRMFLKIKGERTGDDEPQETRPLTIEEVILKCCFLWKNLNGINATFFSFVGIFQQSGVFSVSDWLLNNNGIVLRENLDRVIKTGSIYPETHVTAMM